MPSYDSLKHWRQVALSKVAFEFLEGVKKASGGCYWSFSQLFAYSHVAKEMGEVDMREEY